MKNTIKTKSKKLNAFTLIEMLIVIVIIGILAAALIPKLNSARGRANDVARKADLSQIAAGLISSQIDKGQLPDECGALSLVSGDLSTAGLDELPIDPAGFTLEGIGGVSLTGEYGYCGIVKHNQSHGGFVVMATSETEGGANYVICGGDDITSSSTFDSIQNNKCLSFVKGTCGTGSAGVCQYSDAGQLRYIYIQ